jgi:hypothetical protein
MHCYIRQKIQCIINLHDGLKANTHDRPYFLPYGRPPVLEALLHYTSAFTPKLVALQDLP